MSLTSFCYFDVFLNSVKGIDVKGYFRLGRGFEWWPYEEGIKTYGRVIGIIAKCLNGGLMKKVLRLKFCVYKG